MGKSGLIYSYTPSYIYIYALLMYIYISKIVTFINMVITGVKNGSPDMILTAFDWKFDEKKNEIPPGPHRLPYTSKFSILEV